MSRYVISGVLMFGVIMVIGGCSDHYRVTDPTSGKVYYTQDIHEDRGGAVKLKDERTGSTVTLQNTEVAKISEDEYEAGLRQPTVVTKPPVATTRPPAATQPPVVVQP